MNDKLKANLGWERQLLCHFFKHRFHFPEFNMTSDLYYQPAALYRCNIVVDGTFASSHALTQAFTSNGLVRSVNPPMGEGGTRVHTPINSEPHHLHMAPVQISSTHGLERAICLRNKYPRQFYLNDNPVHFIWCSIHNKNV